MKFKSLIGILGLSFLLMFSPGVYAVPGGSNTPELLETTEPTIAKSMIVENPNIELSFCTSISENRAFIRLYSGLNVADVVNVWNDLLYLKYNTDITDVDLFISSPGGDAFSGLAMSDWIIYAQDKWGFVFHAQASGIVASAAVPVFAVCKNRLALPGTIFMVHEAAIWKWPGRETHSDIISQGNLMSLLQHKYLKHLVNNSNLTLEEWKVKEKMTSWFGVEDARAWGLIERGE